MGMKIHIPYELGHAMAFIYPDMSSRTHKMSYSFSRTEGEINREEIVFYIKWLKIAVVVQNLHKLYQ